MACLDNLTTRMKLFYSTLPSAKRVAGPRNNKVQKQEVLASKNGTVYFYIGSVSFDLWHLRWGLSGELSFSSTRSKVGEYHLSGGVSHTFGTLKLLSPVQTFVRLSLIDKQGRGERSWAKREIACEQIPGIAVMQFSSIGTWERRKIAYAILQQIADWKNRWDGSDKDFFARVTPRWGKKSSARKVQILIRARWQKAGFLLQTTHIRNPGHQSQPINVASMLS